MQFRVDKAILKRTLTAAKRIVPNKTKNPILRTVLIQSNCESCIRITATDSDLFFTAEISADVIEPGTMCMPVKKLLETLNTLDGELTFVAEDAGNSSAVTINGLRFDAIYPVDYPETPVSTHENGLGMVSRATWVKAMTRVLLAAASPEIRPNYAGVFINVSPEQAVLVATDTYQLAMGRVSNEDAVLWPEARLFVPAKLVAEVIKARATGDTLVIRWDEINRMVKFSMSGLTLSGRMMDSEFPHFEKVIPKAAKTPLYLDREGLQAVLRKAALYPDISGNSATIVELEVTEGKNLRISATYLDERPDGYSETLTLKREAKDVRILLDTKYLLSPLNYLGNTVRLDLLGHKEAATYREDDYLYLILPVRREKKNSEEVEYA